MKMCVLDLDDIEAGNYTNSDGEIIVPEAKSATLPRFVQEYVREHICPNGNSPRARSSSSINWTS